MEELETRKRQALIAIALGFMTLIAGLSALAAIKI